jgi:integrase
MLIAAEVDPKTISRLMGHSSVAFTLDQYAKVFARHEKTMVERFDAYLQGAEMASSVAQFA